MKNSKAVQMSALALLLVQPAAATLVFSDNFNSENGGAAFSNFTAFTQWDVSGGTVDLAAASNPNFFGLPGSQGLIVDMDGSSGNAGKISTKSNFTFAPGNLYTLDFLMAGNRRFSENDTVLVRIGSGIFSYDVTLPRNAPFTPFHFEFSVAAAFSEKLSFEGVGGNNVGLILDDVVLSAIPTAVPEATGTVGFLAIGLLLLARGCLRPRRDAISVLRGVSADRGFPER